MSIPVVPGYIELLNTADWRQAFTFNRSGSPRDFTGSTITGALSAMVAGQHVKVPISSIVVSGNIVCIVVPVATLSSMATAIWDWAITEHRADGVVSTLLTGKVKLDAGPEA